MSFAHSDDSEASQGVQLPGTAEDDTEGVCEGASVHQDDTVHCTGEGSETTGRATSLALDVVSVINVYRFLLVALFCFQLTFLTM